MKGRTFSISARLAASGKLFTAGFGIAWEINANSAVRTHPVRSLAEALNAAIADILDVKWKFRSKPPNTDPKVSPAEQAACSACPQ